MWFSVLCPKQRFLTQTLLVLDTVSHQRSAHKKLQSKRRKEPNEHASIMLLHWHKGNWLHFSHLHGCNDPKKHKLIFHLHFLTTSKSVGIDLEDPPKHLFIVASNSSLGTLQHKTEQNLALCKYRACMHVCTCMIVRKWMHITCHRDAALDTMSRRGFHLWFW